MNIVIINNFWESGKVTDRGAGLDKGGAENDD